jgi:methylthioribose-1-phosphate isomerase
MEQHAAGLEGAPFQPLLAQAQRLHAEDLAANHRMGLLGAALIDPASRVMTHCNAGALATAGHGTALGVIRDAHAAGKIREVFATETRPWLQGARLTAWELARAGIPVRLITDGSAAHVMRTQAVSWVIVGADRVAANGDVANKIGTYSLAIAARAHGTRFMVVAPCSTIDLATPHGDDIVIEERPATEITTIGERAYAPRGVGAFNPVFDVTPAALIDVLVTDRGVLQQPDRAGLQRLLGGPGPALMKA